MKQKYICVLLTIIKRLACLSSKCPKYTNLDFKNWFFITKNSFVLCFKSFEMFRFGNYFHYTVETTKEEISALF